MPTQRHQHDLATLLAQIDDDALIKGRTFKKLIVSVMRGMIIAGRGLKPREAPDGIILDVTGLGGAGSQSYHPFQIVVFTVGTSLRAKVILGTVNGIVPDFGPGLLDDVPPPSVFISTSREKKFWLHLTTSLEVVDEFLVSYSPFTVEVETGLTVPENDGAAGEFYIYLGNVVDGVAQPQPVRTSLWASLCDAGSGAANLTINQA